MKHRLAKETTNSKPLVSVVIVSWNRKDDLEESLNRLKKQTYKKIEIIVVDNNSKDGTPDMIKNKFSSVRLIEMPQNIGIKAYNIGMNRAKGSYLVILDDDSFPAEDAIEKSVRILENNPRIGVIAFHMKDYFTKQSLTAGWGSEVTSFWGCGAIIRKEVLDKVGYYPEEFFLYHNEADLAIRIIDAGYSIRYYPDIVGFHKIKAKHKSSYRSVYFSTRNRLWYLWKYYHLWWMLRLTIREMFYQFYIAIINKQIKAYFKALIDAFFGIPLIKNKRRKVKKSTQKFIIENYCNINRPSIWSALIKVCKNKELLKKKWGTPLK